MAQSSKNRKHGGSNKGASHEVVPKEEGKKGQAKATSRLAPPVERNAITRFLFPSESTLKGRLCDVSIYYLLLQLTALLIYGGLYTVHPVKAFVAAVFTTLSFIVTVMNLKEHIGMKNSFVSEKRGIMEFTAAGLVILLASYTYLG